MRGALIAGFFVFLGVATLGYRDIRTIGKELTEINYQRGFCIEFASTLTVVLATVLEMPAGLGSSMFHYLVTQNACVVVTSSDSIDFDRFLKRRIALHVA